MHEPRLSEAAVPESARAPTPATAAQARKLLVSNLSLIRRLVGTFCRRQRRPAHEEDDALSEVLLKLVERNYRVLRRYSSQSQLSTYLATVIQNHLRDDRNRRWGKWRPSKAALSHGTVAVELEKLLVRDGFSLDEAVEVLIRNHGVKKMPADLFRLAEKLPPRALRRFETDDALQRLPVDGEIEDRLRRRTGRRRARSARQLLTRAMAELSPRERRILRDRYQDGITIATIARRRGLDQRRLYRSHDRCLAVLRRKLQATGLSRRSVAEMLHQGDLGRIESRPSWMEIGGETVGKSAEIEGNGVDAADS